MLVTIMTFDLVNGSSAIVLELAREWHWGRGVGIVRMGLLSVGLLVDRLSGVCWLYRNLLLRYGRCPNGSLVFRRNVRV